MKKYNVTFTFTLTVEAKNEEEAQGKAIDMYSDSSTYVGYENIEETVELVGEEAENTPLTV